MLWAYHYLGSDCTLCVCFPTILFSISPFSGLFVKLHNKASLMDSLQWKEKTVDDENNLLNKGFLRSTYLQSR